MKGVESEEERGRAERQNLKDKRGGREKRDKRDGEKRNQGREKDVRHLKRH